MNKKEIEEVEKHNEYVMERMHAVSIIPGVLVAGMVTVGRFFKGKMARC